MDDVKSGIPSVPSDEVLQGIIDEVELHMYCDQWATCCVCDQRAPSVALSALAGYWPCTLAAKPTVLVMRSRT